jgi:hypothetical protein
MYTQKTLISVFTGLALTACSVVAWQKWHVESPDEAEENKQEMMQAYYQQEFAKVVDPALGRVPTERLQPALKAIQRQESRQTRTAAVSGLTWAERGPNNIGGRTRALLFDKNDASNKKVWAGSVGGGLWFTNDITAATPVWSRPANADQFNNLAVTCIAQDPTNSLTMYFGTGEGFNNMDAIQGSGIWKTVDGGVNWTQLTNTIPGAGIYTHYIQKIVVTSGGTVLAATKSSFCNWGGIYRSTNAGINWTRIQMPDRSGNTCNTLGSSHTDLEISADGTVYTTNGIGFQGGIYSSADNGATWSNISPAGTYQRVEIAAAPSDANRIYALSSDGTNCNNIWESTNKGATWTNRTIPTSYNQGNNSNFAGQSWYALTAAVDPNDANTLYIGGLDALRSTDEGQSWTQITTWANYNAGNAPTPWPRAYVHADLHAIVFAPSSSSTALMGCDGGIFYSTNINGVLATGTPSFASKSTGYNVTQYFAAAIHPTACSNNILAGAQDNGTQKFTTTGINAASTVTGGDGAFCHIDQDNPNLQISSYIYNQYWITNNNWSTYTTSNLSSNTGSFINPTEYDDANNLLYVGHSSGSYGVVSGGLLSGGSGVSALTQKTGLTGQVGALKVDPNNTSTLWIGSTTGTLHKITNPNASPTITVLPSANYFGGGGYISAIDVEKGNSNHLLVTVSNYGVTSVYECKDGGTTWTSVEGNLPDIPVRWGMFNPLNNSQALLATELGVFSTDNLNGASTNWVSNNSGLAKVRVDMLKYRSSDYTLVAATHGRGIFTTTLATQSPATTASVEQNMESAQVYLGPNADVYCYSSTDGQLIARIKNLSAHDYGCTSVAVTRATGAGTPQAFTSNTAALAIAPKTLQITPTTNNSAGNYQLTMYFTPAEVTAWQNYTGKSWGTHGCIAKCSGNILSVTPAAPTAGGTIVYQMNESVSTSGLAYITSSFTTGFSSFGVGMPASALPLELLDFSGKLENKTAVLSWTTVQEKDVLGFDIERSTDQKSFEKIGFVDAKNQLAPQTYRFKDVVLRQAIQYYRLKIKDRDGSFTYSKVISIQTGERGSQPDFVIAPNPVQAEMQLIFGTMPDTDFDLRIADMAGRQVYERHFAVSEEKTLVIPTENLVVGAYLVTLRMPNGLLRTVKMRKH